MGKKIKNRAGGVAQVVECLPSKCEFNPRYLKKENKNIYPLKSLEKMTNQKQ
jgi:hypothetical protein